MLLHYLVTCEGYPHYYLRRSVVKLWGNAGNGVPLPFLAGERRSPTLHHRCNAENGLQSFDDSYLQHKQQKKMCVKCMI